jgi:hypothetical protein
MYPSPDRAGNLKEILMRSMFNSIFTAIEVLFSGITSFATAFKHIGEWTEAEAGFFSDQAKLERKQKIAKLQQQG